MEIDALKFTVLFSSTFVYGGKISRQNGQNSKDKLCFESLKKTTMTQKRYKKKTDPSSTNSRY